MSDAPAWTCGLPPHLLVPVDAALADELALRAAIVLPSGSVDELWCGLISRYSHGAGEVAFQLAFGFVPEDPRGWKNCLTDLGVPEEAWRAVAEHGHVACILAGRADVEAIEEVFRSLGQECSSFMQDDGCVERHAAMLWLWALHREKAKEVVWLSRFHDRPRVEYEISFQGTLAADHVAKTLEKCSKDAELRAPKSHRPFYVVSTFWVGGDGCLVLRDLGRQVVAQRQDEHHVFQRGREPELSVVRFLPERRVIIATRRPGPAREAITQLISRPEHATQPQLRPTDRSSSAEHVVMLVRELLEYRVERDPGPGSLVLERIEVRAFWLPGAPTIEVRRTSPSPLADDLRQLEILDNVVNAPFALERLAIRFEGRTVELMRVDIGGSDVRLVFAGAAIGGLMAARFKALLAERYEVPIGHTKQARAAHKPVHLSEPAKRGLLRMGGMMRDPVPGFTAWKDALPVEEPRAFRLTVTDYWLCTSEEEDRDEDGAARRDGCDALVRLVGSAGWGSHRDRRRDFSRAKLTCTRGHTTPFSSCAGRPAGKVWDCTLYEEGVLAWLLREVASVGVVDARVVAASSAVVGMLPNGGECRVVVAHELPKARDARALHGVAGHVAVLWCGAPDRERTLQDWFDGRWCFFADAYVSAAEELSRVLGLVAAQPSRARSSSGACSLLEFLEDGVYVDGEEVVTGPGEVQRLLCWALASFNHEDDQAKIKRKFRTLSDLLVRAGLVPREEAGSPASNHKRAMARLVKASSPWGAMVVSTENPSAIEESKEGYRFRKARVRIHAPPPGWRPGGK
ncbi:MAG TPA: hypothetical protein PKA64_14525 [Myxococcota bacterium]|nr:hypothetical protein [Myxococcota bacterium]